MFLYGTRDFGDDDRDAFNLEQIEVLEGVHRFCCGSTGGVINQVGKQPHLAPALTASIAVGTDQTRRATGRITQPLPELGRGSAFRLNAMAQDAGVAGRDQAETRRYGLGAHSGIGLRHAHARDRRLFPSNRKRPPRLRTAVVFREPHRYRARISMALPAIFSTPARI